MKSNHLIALLNRLDEAKKLIDAHRPLSPSVLKKLREQFIIEWTYNSNAIEGNTLTLRETRLVLEEGITIGGKPLNEHLEAINHKEAIEFVEALATSKDPMTERDIKDIHALILKKIDDRYAGRYRDIQVRISGSRHTPPDALHVTELMAKFTEDYCANFSGHPLIQAALIHFHFVSIHPFVDGNGRTARLLMNLVLMKNGYPPAIILKNDRKRYYDALESAHSGKTDLFVIFVGRALERTLALYMEVIPNLQDNLLTLAEAEKISPYSKHYLGVMARRGVIPAFKLKRDWMIFRKALGKYVKEHG